MNFPRCMGHSVAGGGSAVVRLRAHLGTPGFGVRQCEVYPGPQGDAQAIGIAIADMTRIPADAYVVPHFQGEASYDGVAGAVVRAGASVGLDQYEAYLRTRPTVDYRGRQIPQQEWGDTVATISGGGLSSLLIHAVTVGHPDASVEANIVSKSVISALAAAKYCNAEHVIFPALGTGIIGSLTDAVSAYAILAPIVTVWESGSAANYAPLVTIAIFGNNIQYRAFFTMWAARPPSEQAQRIAERAGTRSFDAARWVEGMNADIARAEAFSANPKDESPA